MPGTDMQPVEDESTGEGGAARSGGYSDIDHLIRCLELDEADDYRVAVNSRAALPELRRARAELTRLRSAIRSVAALARDAFEVFPQDCPEAAAYVRGNGVKVN